MIFLLDKSGVDIIVRVMYEVIDDIYRWEEWLENLISEWWFEWGWGCVCSDRWGVVEVFIMIVG